VASKVSIGHSLPGEDPPVLRPPQAAGGGSSASPASGTVDAEIDRVVVSAELGAEGVVLHHRWK